MKSLYLDVQSRIGAFDLNVSLNVIGNGVLAVLGASGSGKTTLLRSIAGLHRPDRGFIASNSKVFFNSSQNVHLPPQRRRVGFVFQDYALFDHMTVCQNVVYGIKSKALQGAAAEWLEKLGLQGLAGRYPGQLSGGQRQRVALARALVTQPELLLLDEPFSAIDQSRREKIREDIAVLIRQTDIPAIMVTHDINDARIMADHLLVMHQGKAVQFGPRDTVLAHPANTIAAEILGWRNLLPLEILAGHGMVSMYQLLSNKIDIAHSAAGIQPYHLRFTQDATGALPVTVTAIYDKGAVREVKCAINGTGIPVYLDVPWNHPVAARNEQALITASPGHVQVFGINAEEGVLPCCVTNNSPGIFEQAAGVH